MAKPELNRIALGFRRGVGVIRRGRALWGALALGLAVSGCSIKRYAARQVAAGMGGEGNVFASDDDPELVREALPFALKLLEGLVQIDPEADRTQLAACSGFVQYAYAFVQQEADELETTNFEAAEALRRRARRLYLRAKGYGLRGLELRHPGFAERLASEPEAAVRALGEEDVPFAYWTALSWAAAVSLAKDDPRLIGELPQAEALIDRALELDETWGRGALHTFMIQLAMAQPGPEEQRVAEARKHFLRAALLSKGLDASPYVAFAEAVAVQEQDLELFRSLLRQALAIDPDLHPSNRLLNLVMQRRARWLLARTDELFLILDKTVP